MKNILEKPNKVAMTMMHIMAGNVEACPASETPTERTQRIYESLALMDNPAGVKIRVSRDYTSRIVSIFMDGKAVIAAYKDWNKYKQRWDYHCEPLAYLSYAIGLYEQMYEGKYGTGKERKEFK